MALYGRAVLTSQLQRSSPWGVNSFCFSPVLFHKENKSLHSPLKRTLRGYDHRLWTAIFAAKCCFCLVNKLPSQNDEATKSEPELFRPFVGMTSHTFIWNTFLNFHVEYLRRVATARKRCLISLEVFLFSGLCLPVFQMIWYFSFRCFWQICQSLFYFSQTGI